MKIWKNVHHRLLFASAPTSVLSLGLVLVGNPLKEVFELWLVAVSLLFIGTFLFAGNLFTTGVY